MATIAAQNLNNKKKKKRKEKKLIAKSSITHPIEVARSAPHSVPSRRHNLSNEKTKKHVRNGTASL
jgi:hypothetical protein